MAEEGMADVLLAPTKLYYFVLFLQLILYIMLMLPSLMTEKSFWKTEQRLLTLNWMKNFSLMSRTRGIYSKYPNRHSSPSFAGERDGKDIVERDRGAL